MRAVAGVVGACSMMDCALRKELLRNMIIILACSKIGALKVAIFAVELSFYYHTGLNFLSFLLTNGKRI